MNEIKRQNIKLLNLIDLGHSGRTLMRILSAVDDNELITEEVIIKILGNTPTAKSIINDLDKIDKDLYSINCLIYFDVNVFIVDKLTHSFGSLNELAKNIETIAVRSFNSNTRARIMLAIKELEIGTFKTLKDELLNEISTKKVLRNSELKTIILNKHKELKFDEYDQCINQMISQKLVIETVEGLKIKQPDIYNYLISSLNEKDKLVLTKLEGGTFQEVADKLQVTKQYISLVLKRRIPLYPIFYNEEKYRMLLEEYDIDISDLVNIGYDNRLLIEYVRCKYQLHPQKDFLDYIKNFNLLNDEIGKRELNKRNLLLFDGELINKNFVGIFKRFILQTEYTSFDLKKIAKPFNEFLNDSNVFDEKLYIRKNNLFQKSCALARDSLFINVNHYLFILFKPDELSHEFIEACDNYLSEFEGYGSVEWFFYKNAKLCKKNNILDENQLFAVLKNLFGDKYKEKIDFIRNPVIAVKGIDKEEYLENLILDLDMPCTIETYLNYVNEKTGLKKASILAQFSGLLAKYKNVNGLISLDDDISTEEKLYLKKCLDGKKCIGYKYLYDLVDIKYGYRTQILLNRNVLKKLGYTRTETSIYFNCYSCRIDAVNDVVKDLDYIVTENDLIKIANKEYFYYNGYDGYVYECSLVQISKQKYLNILKRGQVDLIKKIKARILNSVNDDEVVEFNNYINSNRFKKILYDEDIKNLLDSFGEYLLKFIIMTIKELSYLETDTSLIFSKHDLTIGNIIYDLLEERKCLSLLELQELLNNEYGICREVSNEKLAEIGLYCPRSSDRVYLNKEYYEKEMEVIFNGNFKS